MEKAISVKTRPVSWLAVIVLIVGVVWFVGDLLLDKPKIHEGIIVSMEYIPGKMQTG